METIIKAVPFDELDFDEFARLQQRSFQDLLRSRGFSETHLTPSFFKWKYDGPFGKAVVNVSLAEGEMAASSTILPMQMKFNDEQFTIWNCGDNASLPELKAKSNFRGAFRSSLMYPTEKGLVYGFPNENAMNTILKTGGEVKQTIPYYISPAFNIPFKKYTQTITRVTASEMYPDVSTLFFRKGEMNIIKNPLYFNWRYTRNPVNTYQYCISHNRENSISGFIITRDLVFKGIKFILIMELYAEHECVSGELIRYACSLHRGSVAVLSISNCDEHYGWKRGFLKLPDSMLPKKQIMTTFNRGLDSNIYQAPMKIQTGDWDSF